MSHEKRILLTTSLHTKPTRKCRTDGNVLCNPKEVLHTQYEENPPPNKRRQIKDSEDVLGLNIKSL